MNTIRIICTLCCMLVFPFSGISQTVSDLFYYSGDKLHATSDSRFISNESKSANEKRLSSWGKVYTYKSNIETAQSGKKYRIEFVGLNSDSHSSCFEAVRIYTVSTNALLLEHQVFVPMENVTNVIAAEHDTRRYIKIPLDNDSFALLLGSIIYDGDDSAPEMLIIIVHKDQAKVVFDTRAFAYSFSPAPNFSVEFVDVMSWGKNAYGNDDNPTAEPLSSKTKYKIWKEGNMLKYKSWK